MSIKVLKEILIAKGKADSYSDGQTPIDLWRALNKKSDQGVFDFIEKGFILSNGRPRPADITIEYRDGTEWVCIKDRPRGLSTFDKPGLPKGKNWEYYKIPAGTVLPEGIAIVKDEYNTRFEATHYTIAPAYDMPLNQFKNKLKILEKSLIKEAI
ncbi:hypothetical protein [Microbulbifer sp. THAF38]|uniref:Tse2 family ADP-ribosyltransferase toxin n=1 Tax=unclassified Microbulbifer TaxID=2619833 RepID=UPI0012A851F1|nr:hypothetical protein [Microbulbifer sp. THAF38]QFT53835.1 hypothetical protein FIU95_04510 [Microbulbifer sp. THAF38]